MPAGIHYQDGEEVDVDVDFDVDVDVGIHHQMVRMMTLVG